MHAVISTLCLLAPLALASPVSASEQNPAECLALTRATAFAPRNEIYIELREECGEADFAISDPISATVEVLISDLPPVAEDVQLYSDEDRPPATLIFDTLEFSPGNVILVRLIASGEVLGLLTVTAR